MPKPMMKKMKAKKKPEGSVREGMSPFAQKLAKHIKKNRGRVM